VITPLSARALWILRHGEDILTIIDSLADFAQTVSTILN
jgi:hypothetical protein